MQNAKYYNKYVKINCTFSQNNSKHLQGGTKMKKAISILLTLMLTLTLMFSCVSVKAQESEPQNLFDYKASFSTEKWLDNDGWSYYPYVRTADGKTVGVFDESTEEYTTVEDYGTTAWFKSNFISADMIHTSGQAVSGIVFEAPRKGLVNIMQSFDITGKPDNIYKFAVYKAKAETTEEGKIQDADIMSTVYPVNVGVGSFGLTISGTYEVLTLASNGTAKINIDEIVEVEAGEKLIFVIVRANAGGGTYDKFMFDEFKVAYIENVYDYKTDFSTTQLQDNMGWSYYPNINEGYCDDAKTYGTQDFKGAFYGKSGTYIGKDKMLFTDYVPGAIVYEAPKDGFIKVRHSVKVNSATNHSVKYGIFHAAAESVEAGKIQNSDLLENMVYPANRASGLLSLGKETDRTQQAYDVIAGGQSREVDEIVKVKAGEKIIITAARATGSSITYFDFNELKISYLISGDISGDYTANANDLVTLKELILNVKDAIDFADVNVDGKINVVDLVRLKKIIVNK